MNDNELNALLHKFYEGETSAHEERLLREALAGDDVDSLLVDGFEQLKSDAFQVPEGLEQQLGDMIDQWDREEKETRKVAAAAFWRKSAWWVAAASVALVVAATGWWLMHNGNVAPTSDVPVIAATQQPAGDSSSDDEVSQVNPLPAEPSLTVGSEHAIKAKDKKVVAHHRQLLAKAKVVESESTHEQLLNESQVALAALEKFSSTLNKGVTSIDNAGNKMQEIDNKIQQHLFID